MEKIGRIGIVGPESTGKTTLAQAVAAHFGVEWVPEYARQYVEGLQRSYNYADVEAIARQQTVEYDQHPHALFDTEMIITRVWFACVYGHEPAWIAPWLAAHPMDAYLLLQPDIEWQPDPVRENGYRREWLFEQYKAAIEQTHTPYRIVGGQGEERIKNAIHHIKSLTI